ncbi:Putative inner membrane protein [Salmonella sp. NCTC 11881]|nr:Putative inner membrane protein [Salmonella sp. NCTC 11881]
MDKYLRLLSQGDRLGLTLIRLSIAIVFYLDWTTKICAL